MSWTRSLAGSSVAHGHSARAADQEPAFFRPPVDPTLPVDDDDTRLASADRPAHPTWAEDGEAQASLDHVVKRRRRRQRWFMYTVYAALTGLLLLGLYARGR